MYDRCTGSPERPRVRPLKFQIILILQDHLQVERAKGIEPSYAAWEASAAGLAGFSREGAGALLTRPRGAIHRLVGSRIENFARCGLPSVDEWANQFRLDRRMPIGRALALLSVPSESWKPLPKQGHVSTMLDRAFITADRAAQDRSPAGASPFEGNLRRNEGRR